MQPHCHPAQHQSGSTTPLQTGQEQIEGYSRKESILNAAGDDNPAEVDMEMGSKEQCGSDQTDTHAEHMPGKNINRGQSSGRRPRPTRSLNPAAFGTEQLHRVPNYEKYSVLLPKMVANGLLISLCSADRPSSPTRPSSPLTILGTSPRFTRRITNAATVSRVTASAS